MFDCLMMHHNIILVSHDFFCHDILHSMPAMALPESATSNDPIASSVPYGSLRESRFAHPQHGSNNWQGQHRSVRFAGDTNGPSHATMMSSSHDYNSGHAFQPQSLPAYSGFGGIGTYLNRHDNGNSSNNNMPGGAGIAPGNMLGGPGMTSDNMLGGTGIAPNNMSGGAGIGGLLDESSNNTQCNGLGEVNGITEGCSELQLNEGADSMNHGGLPHNNGNASYGLNGFEDNHFDSAPLSSSMTALDILTMFHNNRGTAMPDPSNRSADVDNNATQQNILHQPYYNNVPAQYTDNNEGGSSCFGNDNDDRHANPDTFEAFDLEFE